MAKDIRINSLLCFISSAKNDYANEVLFDLVHSFYSEDDIIKAKDMLAEILNNSVIVRKNPERKKKSLDDVFEMFEEFLTKNRRIIFVSDSYKKMPPLGLEFISPVLCNLIEEITKINNILPKIVDIKSQVVNTADIVRNLKNQITGFESKINRKLSSSDDLCRHVRESNFSTLNNVSKSNPSNGYQELQIPVTPHSDAISTPITSNSESNKIVELQQSIFNKIKADKIDSFNSSGLNNNKVTTSCGGSIAVQQLEPENSLAKADTAEDLSTFKSQDLNSETKSITTDQQSGWNLVENKRKRQRNKKNNSIVTGSKKSSNGIFKGINKTVDVFIGRVDNDATVNDLKAYIEDNFKIKLIDIHQLIIKSDLYRCFRVKVNLVDRDALFNSEMWPEGIHVNKYYRRSVK